MKKFFSLIAAVLFAGSMMAEPIVINAGDVTGIESGTTGDLDCTLQGVYIAWNGAYYNPDNKGSIDIRVYAGKLLKLTAQETFSKVEIIGFAKASLAPSVNAGTITAGASYDQDTEKKEWEDPLLVIEDINANHLEITCNKQMRAYAIRITYGEGETPVLGAWSEIVFTEAVAAADLPEDAVFKSDKEGFEAKITDTDNKMAIDANTCRFGTAEAYNMLNYRLKTGGKSSSKNLITVSVPADGKLRLAVRTGSNSATNRNLVIAQGTDTLYNQIILESQAVEVVEGEDTVKVYPYVEVEVKKGDIVLTYPVGSLNFYAFGFNGTLAPEPEPEYFVVGSMTGWEVKPEFKLEANPEAEGEFMGEFTFAANDELKVVKNQKETWYPDGMDNNYKIEEAGDYTVYFRPEGNVEGWHYGYIYAEKKAELPDPTNCAEAREAALSVSANNELYKDGKEYTIEGYVTVIQSAWNEQYKNITFWMADEKDGGQVLEAYRAVCETAADAPAVGDKVKVTGQLTKYGNTPEFAAGCTFVITEKAEPVDERELVKVGVNVPAENKPADDKIEIAGTFAEGTHPMEKIEATGWFVSYEFVNAAEDDTFKFRDKENNNLVLCQFIPANGEGEGQWVQAIFKFGQYWSDDTWKGTPCKLIELDLGDGEVYAWKEGMPEEILPDPTNCAEAREAALSVSANNELYNGGKEYTIEGYVTVIQSAWNEQYKNITFWMADEKDGGQVLEAYRAVCEAEADAPAVGDKVAVTGQLTKYGNTPEFAAGCTYVITEKAEPEPEMNYYVVGNMTNWGPKAEYKLAANPEAEGEFMGEFTFAANDEFKVAYSDGATIADENWFPTGMENNFKIDEAGDYFVYFRPDGQGGEGWHEGYIYALKKEPVVVKQYEVAEAIAAGLADDTEILVRGIITKMEIKGKNFAKYGSVNIYVADATGAEGEFEYYNCYSLEADTFRATVPEYDPNGNEWIQLEEASDANGNAIHVGDTVIALGKYKLYNEKHELNTGCYLVDIKHATPIEPEVITITELTYGEVQTGEFEQWGAVDVVLTNIPIVEGTLYGDGYIFMMDIAPENANDITGVYSVDSLTLDPEYSVVVAYQGTDTTKLDLVDGAVAFQVAEVNIEQKYAALAVRAELLVEDGTIFVVSGALYVYYEFIEEQGIEEIMAETENGKAIKLMHEGQIYILKGNKLYNVNGQSVR